MLFALSVWLPFFPTLDSSGGDLEYFSLNGLLIGFLGVSPCVPFSCFSYGLWMWKISSSGCWSPFLISIISLMVLLKSSTRSRVIFRWCFFRMSGYLSFRIWNCFKLVLLFILWTCCYLRLPGALDDSIVPTISAAWSPLGEFGEFRFSIEPSLLSLLLFLTVLLWLWMGLELLTVLWNSCVDMFSYCLWV